MTDDYASKDDCYLNCLEWSAIVGSNPKHIDGRDMLLVFQLEIQDNALDCSEMWEKKV